MMLRNIIKNVSFNKEKRQVFNSSSITFAIFIQFSVINSLNQLLNFEILKSIKTLKKKNEKKKQKSRKRRAKNNIDINYFKEKFMNRSKFFKVDLNIFKKIIVYVVLSNNLITFSIINEIINQFVA